MFLDYCQYRQLMHRFSNHATTKAINNIVLLINSRKFQILIFLEGN